MGNERDTLYRKQLQEANEKLDKHDVMLKARADTLKEHGDPAHAPARDSLARLHDKLSDDELPRGFRCSLSLERFRDPVMLVQSGFTYERAFLLRALDARPNADPQTNALFEGAPQIAPNLTLKGAVSEWFDAWVARRSDSE